MFDLQASLAVIQGVLTDPVPTAQRYAERNASWQTSFMQVTLPVYALVAIVMLLFGGLFGAVVAGWGVVVGFGALLIALVGIAWTFILAAPFLGVGGCTVGWASAHRNGMLG